MSAIYQTDFKFSKQTKFYRGKVRDVYTIDNKFLVMVASDRISAFDVILPKPIPCKGQVLNQVATHFLNLTKNIVPNWLLTTPDANVAIGKMCEPFKVEMVIRGYLTGHAAREYKLGKRLICGVPMPEGMKENDKFPEPLITPTTKADEGHDLDISREEIIKSGLVKESDYIQLENYTRALFKFGSEEANRRGLILVDTKYEFGKADGKILLIDEIHTPDSSRYFYSEGYEEKQRKGEPQMQLSKEFVREWLIANNFMGKDGQQIPEMPDDFVNTVTTRYIELFEKITGNKFQPDISSNPDERIKKNINEWIETNVMVTQD